jgi:hypothetical protein
MQMKLIVDVQIIPDVKNVWDLYLQCKEGHIITKPEWLQRLRQTKRWTKNSAEKTKSFLRSFFGGNSLLTPFYLIGVNVLVEHVQKEIETTTEPYIREIDQNILKELNEEIRNGAKYVLLDGQNRLFEAIVPFFEGELIDDYYDRPFSVLKPDLSLITLNNFKYTDLDDDVKSIFQKTEVIVAEGLNGSIIDYVKSVVDLNDGEPWSKFEASIIQPTALTYLINRDTFNYPVFTSFFGNGKISGNISGMTGSYYHEKKGDARFISELVNFVGNGANSGLGSENEISSMLTTSDAKYVKAYERVRNYLTFISNTLDCCLKQNQCLDEKEKPLTKESLRSLILFFDMISNRENYRNIDSPIKISSLKDIEVPKNIIEEFVRWHEYKINSKANPDDFISGEPKPDTYVFNTRGISKDNMSSRMKFILNEFIFKHAEDWLSKSYIKTKSIDYRAQEVVLKRESDYIDRYTKTGKKIDLRSKVSIDHIQSRNGPRNGGDEVENLLITNPLSNSLKSNLY